MGIRNNVIYMVRSFIFSNTFLNFDASMLFSILIYMYHCYFSLALLVFQLNSVENIGCYAQHIILSFFCLQFLTDLKVVRCSSAIKYYHLSVAEERLLS